MHAVAPAALASAVLWRTSCLSTREQASISSNITLPTALRATRGVGSGRARVVRVHAAKGRSKASAVQSRNLDKHVKQSASAKDLALRNVLSSIEGQFGKGAIMQLGQANSMKVETFPSGSLTLDLGLGGGYPRGRIVEIYGPESAGKTSLGLHALAEMQKLGGNVAMIDAEHAFDADYATKLGVNCDELIVCQPESGEMALEVVDQLVRSSAVDVILVDSVAALVPQAEIEGEIGMVQVGAQARLMSQALRKLVQNAAKCNCTVIFINQIRYKIGVIYGSPETTPGGNALKFYCSVRIDIRRTGFIKGDDGNDVGIRVKTKIVKNKVARPYRIAEMDLIFHKGISATGCILDCAEELGVVERKGSWYSFAGERLGQGRDKVVQFLEENPETAGRIEALVREDADAEKNGRVAEDAAAEEEEGEEEAFDAERLEELGTAGVDLMYQILEEGEEAGKGAKL